VAEVIDTIAETLKYSGKLSKIFPHGNSSTSFGSIPNKETLFSTV